MAGTRLVRSTTDRKIAGVAAGLAEYFGLDPTLVRVAWALAVLFGGFGVLAYVVLWIVLPEGVPQGPAVRIAEERYARGEITSEELTRIRADLEGSS
jgi:phage shock protein C